MSACAAHKIYICLGKKKLSSPSSRVEKFVTLRTQSTTLAHENMNTGRVRHTLCGLLLQKSIGPGITHLGGPTRRSRRQLPLPLRQAQQLVQRAHDRPSVGHNVFGASDDTELKAEQMARKTPTLSLLPMPSTSSRAPSPASPSLTGVAPATDPETPGGPFRDPRRELDWDTGGARIGAVPPRPGSLSVEVTPPPRAATMSGRLTAGAATAPAPTESRTRGRKPPPGRGDRSVAGGVHSEDAGVKEEGGEWYMTSSSKDEWGMLSSDIDGEVGSPCPF